METLAASTINLRGRSRWRARVVGALVVALIAGLAPQPAAARWQPQELPGIESGTSIAVLAIVGAAAVAGLIIWAKKRGEKEKLEYRIQPPQFSRLEAGQRDSQMVGITNLMGDPITIKEVSLEGNTSAFSLTDARQVPFTVAPGERVDIAIHYAPTGSGGSGGKVRVVATSAKVQRDTVKTAGFSARN